MRKNLIILIAFVPILYSCVDNHRPDIVLLESDPEEGPAGSVFILSAQGFDKDGDILTYFWSAEEGPFLDPVEQKLTRWRSPLVNRNQKFDLKIEVSDGEYTVSKKITIKVIAGQENKGSLSGYVYYPDCKIPINEVVLSLDREEYETDETGYFIFENIPRGTKTLKAEKPGFGTVTKAILIESNKERQEVLEMYSDQFTIKVYGNIIHELNGNPLNDVHIIVLNPNNTFSNIRSVTDEKGYYELNRVPSHMEVPICLVKDMKRVYEDKITSSETDKRQDILVPKEYVFNTGSISGYVYYANTKIPVTYYVVTLNGNSREFTGTGYFKYENIPEGTHKLKVWRSGFDQQIRGIVVEGDKETTEVFEMISDEYTITVNGHITHDPTGEPIPGADVIVLNPDDSYSGIRSTTNSEGYYELFTVPSHMDVNFCIVKDDKQVFNGRISYSIVNKTMDLQIPFEFEFEDPRDGNTYLVNTIGEQVWMLENLAYLPEVNSSSKGSTMEPYYYVYGNESTNTGDAKGADKYNKYGVLYNWPAATNACPEGWHLPSDKEWYISLKYMEENFAKSLKTGWLDSGNSGQMLKSISGWYWNGNGENYMNFNVLPSGYRSRFRGYEDLTKYAYFWTSDSYNDLHAWTRAFGYHHKGIERHQDDKNSGFSIRCVMD